jgi:Ca2+-binding RTX toxin-like protein
MIGGLGDDTYVVDNPTDRILERAGEGTDQVLSSVTHVLGDSIENLALIGTAATTGLGNVLDNILRGNTGANALAGGAGDDVLIGGLGNDRLDGGLGSDLLAGGAGADMFSFTSVAGSPASALRDTIADFTAGLDRINLSSLDTNPLVAGDQAFTFLGADAFRGLAGDLRVAGGIVEADLDGDRIADLSIAVRGITTLDAADFFL